METGNVVDRLAFLLENNAVMRLTHIHHIWMRNIKSTGSTKTSGIRWLQFLQLQGSIEGGRLPPTHKATLSIIDNTWLYPNVSMANSGEKMHFEELFVFIIAFTVQLSENVALPHVITIDPDVLQCNRQTLLTARLIYFHSFENTSSSTAE
jgi:hypothetical protein